MAAAISRSRFPGRRSTTVAWPDIESVISLAMIHMLLCRVSSSNDRIGLDRDLPSRNRWRRLGRHFYVDHDQRGWVSGVADAQGDHSRGGHQDAADEQGLVVSGI
jgi:hypothetical protein